MYHSYQLLVVHTCLFFCESSIANLLFNESKGETEQQVTIETSSIDKIFFLLLIIFPHFLDIGCTVLSILLCSFFVNQIKFVTLLLYELLSK